PAATTDYTLIELVNNLPGTSVRNIYQFYHLASQLLNANPVLKKNTDKDNMYTSTTKIPYTIAETKGKTQKENGKN
ncbi:MAG TPA: hypothetical protein VFZ42_02010, partial [Chitinophagaceae bacterium]